MISSQLTVSRGNISWADTALEKVVRKGWFNRTEKLQAEDKRRSQQETNRREMKERRMLTE